MAGINPMNMIMNMLAQGKNNPQAFAQNILQNNPQFAQQIQGQNLQDMAMNMMRKNGLDPNAIMNMFGKR